MRRSRVTDKPAAIAVAALAALLACAPPSSTSDAGVGGGAAFAPCPGCDCTVCRDEKCADVVARCADDDGCACAADCLGARGVAEEASCVDACGLAERPDIYDDVVQCVAVACPDDDECATPAGWEPFDDSVLTTTADIGDGAGADCGFDESLAFDPSGPVLQLESVDGSVCVRIERTNDGAGALANTQWTLVDLRVGPLGQVAHVDDAAAICWYSSHHNFADVAHAWTGARHYDVKLDEYGHGGARAHSLTTSAQGPVDPSQCAATVDGVAPLDAPLRLFPYAP